MKMYEKRRKFLLDGKEKKSGTDNLFMSMGKKLVISFV